jgi:hypothetical protein
VTITLTPLADLLVEGPETVTLTLSPNSAFKTGAPGTETGTITIADNPTVVSIVSEDADATEAGPTTGTFTVTRTGGATSQSMNVVLQRTGTATASSDFVNFSNVLTFNANQTSVTITVTPVNDALVEGLETVILTIAASTSTPPVYSVGVQNSATVTITSDE